MLWRKLTAFLVSWWKHPESFRQALAWFKVGGGIGENYYKDYPAHLHINILPEYQRVGISETLMRLFEERMSSLEVPGFHLVTSNRNHKALHFYRKISYTLLEQRRGSARTGLEGQIAILFAKRLELSADPRPIASHTSMCHSIIPQPRLLESRGRAFLSSTAARSFFEKRRSPALRGTSRAS
jgi:GNAT superfamily N-acetyltransferase